jgi:hypothetical protein
VNRSFGPWSTAIGTGVNPELNTFWKRRLAMLPMLGQTASRVSRRTVLLLGALAVIGLAIPTLKWAGHDPFGNPVAHGAGSPGDSGGGSAPATAENRDSAGSGAVAPNAVRAAEFLPRPTQQEERILAALEKPIAVQFVDSPLEDCFLFIADHGKLDIYVEKDVLADEGVALDQPITLKLEGRRLESVLNLLLRPVQLAYLIEDDVLKITTSSKAQERLITRTYPVHDLYREPASVVEDSQHHEARVNRSPSPVKFAVYQGFGGAAAESRGGFGFGVPQGLSDLVKAILTTIEPDSWEHLSGPGSYSYVAESQSLVIRQTWAVHRRILQLLRDLREAKGKAKKEKP